MQKKLTKNNTLDKSRVNAGLKFDNVSIEFPDTINLNNLKISPLQILLNLFVIIAVG